MSNQNKSAPYVYQPFGTQDTEHWDCDRIYAVSCNNELIEISGLTKQEAHSICEVMKLSVKTYTFDRGIKLAVR